MVNLLTNISEASLMIYIAALLFSLIASKYARVDTKYFDFILSALVGLMAIHIYAEITMLEAGKDESYKTLVRHTWYLFYAITDFIYLGACVYFIRKFDGKYLSGYFAIACIIAGLGLLQLARYFDRLIIETDVLGGLYRDSVPIMYVVITSIVLHHCIRLGLTIRKGK